ncbi:MAG: phosphoglucosamine mutase [Saezia sp.]
MARQYFGTDGIRGKVGNEPMTPDFILRLAYAVSRVLLQTEERPKVLIGKDTRISGYMLESALESGFSAMGVAVILVGPIPTPAVAYLTKALRASLGVVISASHNPFDDNGIKFFDGKGKKLPDEWEMAVEQALNDRPQWVGAADLGKARRLDDADGRYIEFCKNTFSQDLTLKNVRIVVDAAHGAAYHIAPRLLTELGAEVIAMGAEPDGININAGVGATHPEAMVEAVKKHKADFGIALDGDADRLLFADANGTLYDGDQLLYLLTMDRVQQGDKVSGVVGTLMTNMAIENALKAKGIAMVRAKVGDRYVLEALNENGWILGGEGSGHLLVLDKHTTGDGLISALQVLQACIGQGKTLAELLADVKLYPQVLLNKRVEPGFKWQDSAALKAARLEAEKQLGERGRVLIRASGTEPLLRVMVEAQDATQAQNLAQMLVDAITN